MGEMAVSISFGELSVELTYEGGWNPDVAEDMTTRAYNAFIMAITAAAGLGLMEFAGFESIEADDSDESDDSDDEQPGTTD